MNDDPLSSVTGMDQLRRFHLARADMVNVMPFLGHLALYLKPALSETVPTLRVWPDGTLIVNPVFLAGLNHRELLGCIAHETLHVALLFWSRLKTRDPELFNIAHDHVVNLAILDLGIPAFQIPTPAFHDQAYRGLSAEEIYDILCKKRRNHKLPALGFDCSPVLDSTVLAGVEDQWRVRVIEAKARHEATRGSLPGTLTRQIDLLVKPRITWRDEVLDFVGSHGRLRRNPLRPSRRSEALGELIPSLVPAGVSLVVLIDTSSSINRSELSSTVSEVTSLAESIGCQIRVLVIDAGVHKDIEVSEVRDLVPSLVGGGGSNFIPAFRKLESEMFCGSVVAFTDGRIDVPQTQPENVKEVLWVIGEKHSPPCSWGRTVRMVG